MLLVRSCVSKYLSVFVFQAFQTFLVHSCLLTPSLQAFPGLKFYFLIHYSNVTCSFCRFIYNIINLLTDFLIFVTGTICSRFAVKYWLNLTIYV